MYILYPTPIVWQSCNASLGHRNLFQLPSVTGEQYGQENCCCIMSQNVSQELSFLNSKLRCLQLDAEQAAAGRLPARSPALQEHMPFSFSSISACSPSYTVAEKGSCRVQKWKKIKKELEWLCSSQMWWLPTCSKHHR